MDLPRDREPERPRAALRGAWTLDPGVVFLNHGSFGACPAAVLSEQSRLRARMESEPVRFFVHELEPLLHEARREVAAFVGARAEDLVFVRNATEGVNAVLRSVPLAAGDEILVTDHGYGACRNAALHVAAERGAAVVTAEVPFPITGEEAFLEALLAARTERTRLAIVDHVTSPTGLVLPIDRIARELEARGVRVLVDGAHGPGMVPLDLPALGASYYAANFHKWTCAPKGAAMLWAREDRQRGLHPAVISHGYASTRPRKRFLEEFDWTGTHDPTPALCVPEALRVVGALVPGGWDEVRARNRALALRGRDHLARALGIEPPAPDAMIGALAALPISDGDGAPPTSALYADPLQRALFDRHRVEVPIPPWPAPPRRLIRISAHLYNHEGEYAQLAAALLTELALEHG